MMKSKVVYISRPNRIEFPIESRSIGIRKINQIKGEKGVVQIIYRSLTLYNEYNES